MSKTNEDIWKDAPEGAEYYHPESKSHREHWIKFIGDVRFYYTSINGEWEKDKFPLPLELYKKRPQPSQWNGEGFPPVGTVCEVKHGSKWLKCTIVAFVNSGNKTEVIYQYDDDWSFVRYEDSFRPLRTERDRLIDQLMKDAGLDTKHRQLLANAVDKGWRK